LRELGIAANATERAVRGEVRNPRRMAIARVTQRTPHLHPSSAIRSNSRKNSAPSNLASIAAAPSHLR
jgi:hypothetical protein